MENLKPQMTQRGIAATKCKRLRVKGLKRLNRKNLRRFTPRQSPRPAGQKHYHGRGQQALALAPRNVLDQHSVFQDFNHLAG
jgi:hypothetical protein